MAGVGFLECARTGPIQRRACRVLHHVSTRRDGQWVVQWDTARAEYNEETKWERFEEFIHWAYRDEKKLDRKDISYAMRESDPPSTHVAETDKKSCTKTEPAAEIARCPESATVIRPIYGATGPRMGMSACGDVSTKPQASLVQCACLIALQ